MRLGQIHRWKGKGQEPNLVCLHGFMGNGSDFQIVADSYPDHPTLLAPDFPDYSNEPLHNDHPWAATLENLNRFIHDQSGNHPPVLLGYSMGGRIALEYVLKYQHLPGGLVLVGVSPGIENLEERTQRKIQDAELAANLMAQPLESFVNSWLEQPLLKSQNQIAEPYRTRMLKARYENNRQALAYGLTALGTGTMDSRWNQLREIQIPTLLVTGESDIKFSEIAASMVNHIPNATHKIIPDAGHAACFEKPLDFVQLLKSFLLDHLA